MNERGSAMVLVICVLVVLSAIAVYVVSVATSDKRASFSEYTYNRAFYSADAASEAGLNWIRTQPSPPPILDADNNVRDAGALTNLGAGHSYRFGVQYVNKRFRPGWSLEFKDYEFAVEADGASARSAEAAVDVVAWRLYREGY
jgi:hypothetical protein